MQTIIPLIEELQSLVFEMKVAASINNNSSVSKLSSQIFEKTLNIKEECLYHREVVHTEQ